MNIRAAAYAHRNSRIVPLTSMADANANKRWIGSWPAHPGFACLQRSTNSFDFVEKRDRTVRVSSADDAPPASKVNQNCLEKHCMPQSPHDHSQ